LSDILFITSNLQSNTSDGIDIAKIISLNPDMDSLEPINSPFGNLTFIWTRRENELIWILKKATEINPMYGTQLNSTYGAANLKRWDKLLSLR
jgi:hypothetical protein